MYKRRKQRLEHEFERMMEIKKDEGLIDFLCADLHAAEASAFLASSTSFDIIHSWPGFLSVEEYQRRFTGRPPEKYLVMFRCKGLAMLPSEEIIIIHEHLLEIVLGLDYPIRPPIFIWNTPIWHPNIKPPYLCPEGRPYAIGTTIDQICLMAGQMVQYRNYNTENPLNREAAAWAVENVDRFPIDTRGLLDGKPNSRPLVTLQESELVQYIDDHDAPGGESATVGEQLVELIDTTSVTLDPGNRD